MPTRLPGHQAPDDCHERRVCLGARGVLAPSELRAGLVARQRRRGRDGNNQCSSVGRSFASYPGFPIKSRHHGGWVVASDAGS